MNTFTYMALGWGIGVLVVAVMLLIQAYKDKHDK